MKILLPTDGTQFSDAAASALQRLKLGEGDTIRVISVVDMSVPLGIDLYGGYLPDTAEVEAKARESADRIIGETCGRLREALGADVAIESDVLFGSPDSRIVETAEETGADLIVLGSHGYRRWERLLLGSVSHSVVHHAPCSVMIVRGEL